MEYIKRISRSATSKPTEEEQTPPKPTRASTATATLEHPDADSRSQASREWYHNIPSTDSQASFETANDGRTILSDDEERIILRFASAEEPPPLPPRPAAGETDEERLETLKRIVEANAAEAAASSPTVKVDAPRDDAATQGQTKDSMTWRDAWSTSSDAFLSAMRKSSHKHHQKQELKKAEKERKKQDKNCKDRKDKPKDARGKEAEQDRRAMVEDASETDVSVNSDPPTPPSDEQEQERAEVSPEEAAKEKRELGNMLNRIDMTAFNNRVIALNDSTKSILERFKVVLRDIINGAPHAYDDLEKLLTDTGPQLEKMYGQMPPFVQRLVQTIPLKMYASLAPSLAAAVGQGKSAAEYTDPKTGKKKRRRTPVPPLQDLIFKKGAVAAMLRSILEFLELRFPAFIGGTNVLVSLALVILLFVFWYCHKRGKQERLRGEASARGPTVEEVDDAVDEPDEIEEPISASEQERLQRRIEAHAKNLES